MTTEHTTRDQYMLDIFTTALEGGIGYWSVAKSYHWSKDGQDDHQGFRAEIVETDDDGDETGTHVIDRAVIVKGYGLAAGKYRRLVNWSTEAPPLVITSDTDWDYDAGDADVIVQLGLFGEVIYG